MKIEAKRQRQIFIMLLLGVIAVNIKRIFMDFDIDIEYAIAMSYRMAQGDRMFLQMWEPHQTSAFLSAVFIWIYRFIFHTTTGVVLYLNVVGVLLKGLVTYIVYRTLKEDVPQLPLGYACAFFMAVNPKDTAMPEFSNMQLWFSVLLFCALYRYFKNQKEKRWLVFASFMLCLEVLAYPTCVLVFIPVASCIFVYSNEKWKDILWTTLTCALCGGVFLTYFVLRMGWNKFVSNMAQMLAGDASHASAGLGRFTEYGENILVIVLWIAFLAMVAFLVTNGWKQRLGDKFWLVFFGLVFVADMVNAVLIVDDYPYLFVYLVLWGLGFAVQKDCAESTRRLFRLGMSISFVGVFATLLLSNRSLFSTLGYGILGTMASIICLAEYLKHKRMFLLGWLIPLFLLVTIFRGGFVVKAMTPEPTSILDIRGVVKSGPAVGVMSSYIGPYMINTSMEEWKKYVQPGESLLLVGGDTVHTLGYLYEDIEISVDSTICTPTYSEKLLAYWKDNPKKYPTVIAVECWYGDLRVPKDSWIMQWITEEWQPTETIDGAYWRYYIKR